MHVASLGSDATLPRLAILCDFLEERWPSMDLFSDELFTALVAQSPRALAVEKFRPQMRRRFGRLPGASGRRTTFNLDRLAGRFVDYSLFLRRRVSQFDVFHISDHSYGHLAHAIPAGRCGVYCHDLDAFRCLIEPNRDPRPAWFRMLATHVLSGLQRAAVVFYNSLAVRDELVAHDLIRADRLVHAPPGVASAYTPRPGHAALPGPFLLHVGSCVPRKRVDVLLDVFASVRARVPSLRLVHIGAPFTDDQERRIDRLGIRGATTVLSNVPRERVAEVYSDASIVLLPSDTEGFGLPIIEALACNARVVASDIRVLREVGGNAVVYCPPGDVTAWTKTIVAMLQSKIASPTSEVRLAQAAKFTWREHARIVGDAYLDLMSGGVRNL